MPRFAQMLATGMKERGHSTSILMPAPHFYKLPIPKGKKKWMGYIDQYILFPQKVRKLLKNYSPETLFVFTDQALGPWVPLVADRPHVIHCHDFLAQLSAIGEIAENPTSWTGRQYQGYIRNGYSKGKNFISVSEKTRKDLHRFLPTQPKISEVVYNGLNQAITVSDPQLARNKLSKAFGLDLINGYLLHVGGNQWYKNRTGIVELYDSWRLKGGHNLPLLLIGEAPHDALLQKRLLSPFKDDIHFLSGIEDKTVRLAYTGATVFLFPSLAEGFGWPIAEAMGSGCPVLTTNEPPMTEVAGKAGFFVPRRPKETADAVQWANESANVLNKVINLSTTDRLATIEASVANAKRFDTHLALDKIEAIYYKVIDNIKQT